SRLARAVTLPCPRSMKNATVAATSSMAEPTMASVATSETRRGGRLRGETGPSRRLLGCASGAVRQAAGAAGGGEAGATSIGAGALAWPGLSGAMPGRATPSTVFCAEARRGAPAWADGWGRDSDGGGGGGDGKLGGAMPIIVPAKCRSGGELVEAVAG